MATESLPAPKADPKKAIIPLSPSYSAQPGTVVSITRSDPYAGAGDKPASHKQAEILCAPMSDDDRRMAKVLPHTGAVYLSWSWYAHRLTMAFGPMGWSLLPVMDEQGRPLPAKVENDVMYREYILRADGRYVASAIGECAYKATNRNMTYGDCAEGARSNALSRCCKSLGMVPQLYDDDWRAAWLKEFCIAVVARPYASARELQTMWRKKTAMPFNGEQGHAVGECPCEDCRTGKNKTTNVAADGRRMPPEPKEKVKDAVAVVTDARCITAPQIQRFYTIAHGNGWEDFQIKAILMERGYTSSKSIKMGAEYDGLCDYFAKNKGGNASPGPCDKCGDTSNKCDCYNGV